MGQSDDVAHTLQRHLDSCFMVYTLLVEQYQAAAGQGIEQVARAAVGGQNDVEMPCLQAFYGNAGGLETSGDGHLQVVADDNAHSLLLLALLPGA